MKENDKIQMTNFLNVSLLLMIGQVHFIDEKRV